MHNKKKITLLLLIFMMIIPAFYRYSESVKAEENEEFNDDYFMVLDRDGNVEYKEYTNADENGIATVSAEPETYTLVSKRGEEETVLGEYDTYEEASQAMEMSKYYRSAGDVMVMANNSVRAVDYGIVWLKSKVINYTEADTGRAGYFHGETAADAAYISTSSDGQTVRIKVSGTMMDISVNDVRSIEPYASNSKTSYYDIYSGYLYHNNLYWSGASTAESNARIGYKLDYTQTNTVYYSYDGHYFYKDFKTMINDYRNGNYNNAVNAGNPYYNYYQYLSHHTTSSFSASSFNQFLSNGIKGRDSALTAQGQAFINSQNAYTVNAALMLGVSINESGWGTSTYALTRNNLFGHQAYDSNPDSATTYPSAEASINNHAYDYISKGYLSAIDYRYRGPHLGDKHSGINVKYASDAFWGEKAASHLYRLADIDNSDYGRYTIGIIKSGEQWFYKEANPNTAIFSSATTDGEGRDQVYDFPVTILDTVTGTDGNKWYKVISDTPLTDSRTQISPSSVFKASRDYVYIPTSSTRVVYNGSGVEVPSDGILLGDVNGDGQITPADYVKIKNHIMGSSLLTGSALQAADVNGDGKITPADYVKVKNIIMGR
ncbi:dockerin type I domain-containing protein [Beduini massiliensis]|uniref:dockerin type I domain-containing protein n=1 Tax=Beduini massiliensis TaxID=1585974 RepID=UPI000694ED60|nr:glucosaminidase domain-containing protein [Beduini massiliensis]